MIEAVFNHRLLAFFAHRGAGDQPHHQFDAFGTGFAHVFYMRFFRQRFRVGNQIVQELVVPFFIDQTGARALQLESGTTERNHRLFMFLYLPIY